MDVWVNESVNHCMNESLYEWTWIDSILPLIYDSTNLSTNSESRYTVPKAFLLTQHNTKQNIINGYFNCVKQTIQWF